MQSLKELYKIGNGPSSSHTMGPKRGVQLFQKEYPEADKFKIVLYGSLALTGKGHLTDYIIKETLKGYETEIIFDMKTKCEVHPNTFDISAYQGDKQLDTWRIYSVGGGTVRIEGKEALAFEEVYPQKNFEEIKTVMQEQKIDLYDYVCMIEGKEEITNFLKQVWQTMKVAIEYSLKQEGMIPGKLNLKRMAKKLYEKKIDFETEDIKKARLLSSYAYATSEANACGEVIVTAPTCGACGVLPAVLYYMYKEHHIPEEQIIKALAVAGIIGNVVKTNASISGAECRMSSRDWNCLFYGCCSNSVFAKVR